MANAYDIDIEEDDILMDAVRIATNDARGPAYIFKEAGVVVQKDEITIAEVDETWQMVDNDISACISWRIIVMSG